MASDPASVADAVARTTEGLAQAIDAHARGDTLGLRVNVALAVGTGLTALFTALIAWFTYKAARQAAQSAAASEEMVRIERERQREADLPKVVIGRKDASSPGTGMYTVDVPIYNRGSGPGIGLQCFCAYEAESGLVDATVLAAPEAYLRPGRNAKVPDASAKFEMPEAGRNREIVVCHYMDIFDSPKERRIYHAVYDGRGSGAPGRNHRPGQQMEEEYRGACGICRASGGK